MEEIGKYDLWWREIVVYRKIVEDDLDVGFSYKDLNIVVIKMCKNLK